MSNMAGTKRSADSSETKTFKKQKFDKGSGSGGANSKKSFNAADKSKKPAYGAGKDAGKDGSTVLNGTCPCSTLSVSPREQKQQED